MHQIRTLDDYRPSTTVVNGMPPPPATPVLVLRLDPSRTPQTVMLDRTRVAPLQLALRVRGAQAGVAALLQRIDALLPAGDPARAVFAAWGERFRSYPLTGPERVRAAIDLEWLWHEQIRPHRGLIVPIEEGAINQIQSRLFREQSTVSNSDPRPLCAIRGGCSRAAFL